MGGVGVGRLLGFDGGGGGVGVEVEGEHLFDVGH